MSEKKFAYKEGHKRETRKSYQSYLQQVTGGGASTRKDTPASEIEDMEDGARRSKRTPVPKRGFKLIDDYDDSTPKKKGEKKEEANTPSPAPNKRGASKEDKSKKVKIKDASCVTPIPDAAAVEENTPGEDEPRRSGRVRKPKKFEDEEIESPKKGNNRRKSTEQTPVQTAEFKPAPLLSGRKKSEPEKSTTGRRKSTKETPGEKRKQADELPEAVVTEAVLTAAELIKLRRKKKEEEKCEEEITKKKNEVKADSRKRKPTETEVPAATPVKRSRKVKEGEVTPESSSKKKNKQTPESARKTTPKETKKEKESGKKKGREKLVVSLPAPKSKRKSKENVWEQQEQEDAGQVKQEHQEITSPLEVPVLEDEELLSPSSSKKKKKKKDKHPSSNERLSEVQTFNVQDTQVVKVKKKKIYKKRGGQKVLVRLIKNHMNRTGEVVKSETVVVETKTSEGELKNEPEDDDEHVKHEGPQLEDYELESLSKSSQETVFYPLPADDDEYVPENSSKKKQHKQNEANKRKLVQQTKRSVTAKKVAKAKSRVNRNVLKDGKVVGKTTKGMKKTGVAAIELPPESPNTSDHQTEPKNAYNLFCRKYRNYVRQKHPHADFAEVSRKLATLWQMAPSIEKKLHRDRFETIQPSANQARDRNKLARLNNMPPIRWSDSEFRFIKESIQKYESFDVPKYSVQQLTPPDLAAHLQLLGESLNSIANALHQQSAMNVHGAMGVLLDSILCAVAPLSFMTSYVPEMDAIDKEQQARILDNIAYILPGL